MSRLFGLLVCLLAILEARAACLPFDRGMTAGEGRSRKAWGPLGLGTRLLIDLLRARRAMPWLSKAVPGMPLLRAVSGLLLGARAGSVVPLRLLHARCANLSRAWRIGEAAELSPSSPYSICAIVNALCMQTDHVLSDMHC